MRLIHTTLLAFSDFEGDRIPNYAIVSHRWGPDEISCQTFRNAATDDRQGYGWQKILEGCRMARCRNIRWLWIDTCCIDKTSSAELTESINTMFRYYQQARQCFAFLPDVDANHAASDLESQLGRCIWFTRGWTLQELLASANMNFYKPEFRLIGVKASGSDFCATLSRISGIGQGYLEDPASVRLASVAERMRWASLRETTRIEDLAYCLLGIFDVNMPLLYGEGTKAFMRLQVEIIKKAEDESIYAWHTDKLDWKGLLAPSPVAFAGEKVIESRPIHHRSPSVMTNKGLELRLAILPSRTRGGSRIALFPLNCIQIDDGDGSESPRHYQIAIRIRLTSTVDPYETGLRTLEGAVYRNTAEGDHRVLSHIRHHWAVVGYTKAHRQIKRWRYSADWNADNPWYAYGCSSLIGVFPRAESGEGVTYPVYFKQDGL